MIFHLINTFVKCYQVTKMVLIVTFSLLLDSLVHMYLNLGTLSTDF